MDIFDLAAKLSLDDSGFSKGISDAEKAGKNLGSSLQNTFNKIQSAAKVIISGVAIKKGIDLMKQLANETAAAGDRIDKQSQALGMSRKAYQEWDYILGQNGASIDSLGVSMKTLNSAILSATDGSEEYNGALVKLGLNYVELGNMNMEDQFEAVVRAFQRMPAGAQKSALAVKLFGRNGMELLPLLNQADTSIDELRQKAEELGLVMSDDAVDAAVVYGDSLDDLQRTFNAFKYAIGAKILPTLTTGIQKITNYAGKLRRAYDQKGFTGVWETLVADFNNIKWPTWDSVRSAIETGWNTIVSGVKGLAKIVFGENVDGSIKWPTWDDIGDAITTAWQAIKDGVTGLAKIVFGENVDGSIKWPTWDEVGEAINTAWQGIVDGVKNLGTTIGKVVFGENVDGSIKWPTWDDVQRAVEDGWQTIKDGVAGLATIVFGDKIDITKIDSLGELFTTIESGWKQLRETIITSAINIGTYFFGEQNADTVSTAIKVIADALEAVGAAIVTYSIVATLPKVVDTLKSLFTLDLGGSKMAVILAGIAAAFTLIYEHWDELQPVLESIGQWFNDNIIEPVNEAIEAIKEFFGLGGAPEITQGNADAIVGKYKDYATAGVFDQPGKYKEFNNALNEQLKAAGYTEDQIAKVLARIDQISGSSPTVEAAIQAVSNYISSLAGAESEVASLGESVEGVAGDYDINFHINTYGDMPDFPSGSGMHDSSGGETHGGGGHGFAKGLYSVPYDDYVARLHRGEMVLTASQARRYRDGNSGSVDLSSLGDIVREAIASGMSGATVRSYISGRDVTDDVNRNTIRQLKARRFAT